MSREHARIRPESRPSLAPRPGRPETVYRLPRDLVEAAAQRLAVASLGCAIAFLCAFPVMNLAPPAAGDLTIANVVAAVSVVVALAVFFVTRRRSLDPERLLEFGLVFEVVMGLGIAFAETFAAYEPSATVRGVSWLCLWIVLFPLIVPSTPGKTLVAALATATMGPLALLLVTSSGAPWPTTVTFVYMVLPNYFSAGVALLCARLIHKLGSDVTRARQMGSYQLLEPLGRGGMGEVWRAKHRRLARPAAIKLVSAAALAGKSGADTATLRKRFEREAQATALLTSPNTIQVFDFGVTDDGTLYYVMELLDGVDLETLVERGGPVEPRRVAHVMRQVCASLSEAHATGMIHRDIKPANIYLCEIGGELDHVKVLDFGLVAFQERAASAKTRLTADGQVTGTPAYLAPEIATGDVEPDARVDLYSLGCVGYFLLTGQMVFEGSPIQVLFGHVEKVPPPPSTRVDQPIPEALERVILDCLAKEPEDRPASAADLLGRLDACDLPPWTRADAARWWSAHPREEFADAPSLERDVDAYGQTLAI